jgi:AcrR family transcriptional regulator
MNVSGMKQKQENGPDQERRNPATQAAILTAARKLVVREGYNRVTVEAIAAAARSGKQTIYRWWRTKAALYLEIFGSLSDDALFTARGGPIWRVRGATQLRPLLRSLVRAHSTRLARAILTGLVAEAQVDRAIARALTDHLARRPARLIADRLGAKGGFAAEAITATLWFRLLLGHGKLDRRFADQLAATARHR